MGKEYEIGSFEEKLKMDYRSVFTLQPARPVTYFGVGTNRRKIARSYFKKGILYLIYPKF